MDFLADLWERIRDLANDPVDWWQWGIVAGVLVAALILSAIIQRTLLADGSRCRGVCERFFKPKRRVGSFVVLSAVLLWLASLCAPTDLDGAPIIRSAAYLATAFAIYRLAASVSKGKAVPRTLAVVMLIGFVLHLTGELDPILTRLRDFNIPIGDLQINLWSIASGIIALFFLLWFANLASRFLEVGLDQNAAIPNSMSVLLAKLARFVFYTAAILIALQVGGFNLGALAIFSGALGLGIGFGLQKVVSNLVSGIIILLDKSVKPGDVIEIDDAYGEINSLRTRYVSVRTRDRKEYLIPNEDFITNQVINWSFTGNEIRIKADVGVAYGTDLRKAIELCIDAAAQEDRVLTDPAPKTLLIGFGDSSIDLQIRFWIRDANNGVANIRSAVLLNVWDRFEKEGIEIPFPQRDLNIKGALPSPKE